MKRQIRGPAPFEIQQEAKAFQNWMTNDDPDGDHDFLKRKMKMAIKEELTPTQLLYMSEYYMDGKTVGQIAIRHGVDRSTVSRGIHRAHKRIRKVLKYCSPRLLDATAGIRTYNKGEKNDHELQRNE